MQALEKQQQQQQQNKKNDININEFNNVLKREDGRKAFAIYLTFSLAVENLLFYEQVKRWKLKYLQRSPQANYKKAKKISQLFVEPGSTYEINVDYYKRKELLDATILEEIEVVDKNTFNNCFLEIERILIVQFNGFLQSKLYQIYKSNLGEIAGLEDLENTKMNSQSGQVI